MNAYQRVLPGIKGSLEGLAGLVAQALEHKEEFDGVVLSGRSGAFLAAMFLATDQTVSTCVTRSADCWRGSLSPSAVTTELSALEGFLADDRRLRKTVPEIADLIQSKLCDEELVAYRHWRFTESFAADTSPLLKPPRLLVVDDTVTCTLGGTYSWLRSAIRSCGAQCVGYLASDDDFENGMGGFHNDESWARRYEALCAYEENPDRFCDWLSRRYGKKSCVDPYILELLD